MSADTSKLSPASAAFGLAAAITALFNTVLACVKDAHKPLSDFMGSLTGHNWTTQGIADVILFVGLGLFFLNSKLAVKLNPNRLIAFLAGAVAVAGVGLFAWYALF